MVGILFVGMKKAEYLSLVSDIKRARALSGAVLLLLGGGALFVSVRRTFRPLDALRAAMGDLASGKLDGTIPLRNRADEIGRMAQAIQAIQAFQDQAVAARTTAAEQRSEAAAGESRAERLASLTAAVEAEVGRSPRRWRPLRRRCGRRPARSPRRLSRWQARPPPWPRSRSRPAAACTQSLRRLRN